jgi:uncharacterized membrane protein
VNLIYYFFTVLLLLVNIAGLTLSMRRWLPTFALARAAGLLLLCSVVFFMEHFVGFGKLTWLWPLTTALAVVILYIERHNQVMPKFWWAESVFYIAFAYGFAWKWAFPDIYPTSERVTDLYFIGNYLTGQTLPPLDNWYPPNRFEFYYAFQHYAAALMGRIFGFGPGLTYNLAFALLMALPITLVWDFTAWFLKQGWKRWLIAVTFVIGGTGATPFVHLSYAIPDELSAEQKVNFANDGMWSSQRFIGSIGWHQNTPFGHKVFPNQKKPDWEPRELPMEGFGYQFYVGEYHPPLGGFFLLMVAIAAIGALELSRYGQEKAAEDKQGLFAYEPHTGHVQTNPPSATNHYCLALQGLLAFTVPLMIATNTWAFPLQAALVFGWLVLRYVNRNPPNWIALLIGGGAGFLLLYPFLTGFTSNILPTPIKWVHAEDHSPVVEFLALHWPLMLFGTLIFFTKGIGRIALMFAVVFLGLLLVSEFIFVDDPTGGQFERTNTVMKWWGWIWSGGMVTLATLLLANRARWIQGLVVLALLLINLYVVDVARYWLYTFDKAGAGKLAGHNVYTREPVARDMFNFLEKAPSGIVLENNYGGAFTDSGIYSAFAVKPTLLGWPMHLLTWHNNIDQVWALKDQIIEFYKGQLPDAMPWLVANNVDYIVWNARDAEQTNAWSLIKNSIDPAYAWHEFQSDPNRHIGLWVRRKSGG